MLDSRDESLTGFAQQSLVAIIDETGVKRLLPVTTVTDDFVFVIRTNADVEIAGSLKYAHAKPAVSRAIATVADSSEAKTGYEDEDFVGHTGDRDWYLRPQVQGYNNQPVPGAHSVMARMIVGALAEGDTVKVGAFGLAQW